MTTEAAGLLSYPLPMSWEFEFLPSAVTLPPVMVTAPAML
jgi:hypothetical protein